MNSTTSLKERFIAETPVFWKILGLIGLFLVGLAKALSELPVSNVLITVVASVGATLALASQFAMKDIAVLESTPDTLSVLSDLFPMLKDQVTALQVSAFPIFKKEQPSVEEKGAVVKTMFASQTDAPAVDPQNTGA